jgi:DNA-binding winged helix-turn-helix (wHTH) protein/tetratricopeptide (TPR) repeat protein
MAGRAVHAQRRGSRFSGEIALGPATAAAGAARRETIAPAARRGAVAGTRFTMTEHPGLARRPNESNPLKVRFGVFELDEANARLMREGTAVPVAPTPFAVLCTLVRRPAALLTKHQLLDEVWGHQFVSDSVLKTAISELRAVLGDDPRAPRFIETVSRRGYRFIATPRATVEAAGAIAEVVPPPPPEARPGFVGREAAMRRLHDAWQAVCSGRQRVVWVAGDPGVGKTALIEHFVASLGDIDCVRGQCVESHGEGEPYLPVLEALAELSRADAAVPALLREVAPTWLLQLPWLSTAEEREVLRRELAGASPHRMLREFGELLTRAADRRPLLLVTEDLHWSDRATIQLIDYFARRRGSVRVMWLASFRLADVVARDHPLAALRHELRLHGLCEEVVLDPFSESEVAEFVARHSPALARDETFVRTLHERTDGVPLFVASVARDVIAQARDDAEATRLAAAAVPENLTAIVDHYIAELGDEQRELLAAAAVCGVRFRVTTIADALGRDPASTALAIDALARERRWLASADNDDASGSSDPSVAFRHTLFRQALYERTPAAARARLHRQVGVALQRARAAGSPVAAAELATHFERGREPMAAMRCYAEAAEDALWRFSPVECMSLAGRGLGLLDHAPAGVDRDALECTLATLHGASAFHAYGVGHEATTSLQRAFALLGEAGRQSHDGLLLHGLGFVLCLRGEFAQSLAVADRATTAAKATNDPALLRAAATIEATVCMLQGRPIEARERLEAALAAAELDDDVPGHGFVVDSSVHPLALLAIQLLHLGLVNQARARLREADARALRVGQPMARLVVLWFDALAEVRLGRPERVGALADEMRGLVEKFSIGQGGAACQWFRGWADARMGNPLEGFRRIRDAHDKNIGLGMIAGASETLGYAAEALLLARDFAGAQAQLDQAMAIADRYGERIYLPQLHLLAAAVARGQGRDATALSSVRRAIAEAQAQRSPWLEWLASIELCEHAGATTEDRRALAALTAGLGEATDTPAYARAQAVIHRSGST